MTEAVPEPQRGDRPCPVVSDDSFNAGPAGLIVACPMTTTERGMRGHVEITPPEANLDRQRALVDGRSLTGAR